MVDEIRRFYFDKIEVLKFLADAPPRGEKSYEARILTLECFPPEVRAEYWMKSDKGFNYAGCVARPIDPNLADELIVCASLKKIGEQYCFITPEGVSTS